jgi:anti-sigma regulatory factor (Ser/Thr protein kinase)
MVLFLTETDTFFKKGALAPFFLFFNKEHLLADVHLQKEKQLKRGPIQEIREEIAVAAQAGSVPALVEFVSTHAWECGFQDEAITKINLAVKEALDNILYFACSNGEGEIRISCSTHNSGAFLVTITDTGIPFNMLLASTFPEAHDFTVSDIKPSTKMMKKIIKNVEYRREAERNVLVLIITKEFF